MTPPADTGVGFSASVGDLRQSWMSALFALRIGDAGVTSTVDDYGGLYHLAQSFDSSGQPRADVRGAFAAMESGWLEQELVFIAGGDSLRSVAGVRGVHHSTIAAKLPSLVRVFGNDPCTPLARPGSAWHCSSTASRPDGSDGPALG